MPPAEKALQSPGLYACRWHVELDIRNIKTTLGMEVLRCQTPQRVEKELWVYLLVYNVIRLLMAQVAQHAGFHPRQLSFKHVDYLDDHRIASRSPRVLSPDCPTQH